MSRRDRASNLYFEEIGERFEQDASPYDLDRRVQLIVSLLPEYSSGLSCLEVGCGIGGISRSLKSRVEELTVSDISSVLARGVGEKLQVAWSEQDATALTYPADTFDLVVSSECIEHAPDPIRCLEEMVRVLKPGGTVVVTTPNKLWYPVLVLSELLKVRKFGGNECWIWPHQARKALERSGCTQVTLDGCHLFPWQVPLAKKMLPLFDRFGKGLYPAMINFAARGTKAGVSSRGSR